MRFVAIDISVIRYLVGIVCCLGTEAERWTASLRARVLDNSRGIFSSCLFTKV